METKEASITIDSKTGRDKALQPIHVSGRIFNKTSYILMWWASIVVIQGFILGQGMLPPAGDLNILQSSIVILLGGIIVAVLFSLLGKPGVIYGIPFAIQCRSSFGYKGTWIAQIIRSIPAIFWFGISSWIGAMAINQISNVIFGLGNVWIFFFAFQILQVILAYHGIESIKKFETFMGVVVALILGYMAITLITHHGFEIQSAWRTGGTWGLPFYFALTATVGSIVTGSVNASDLTRYLEQNNRANWIGHFVGIVPSFFVLVFIGVLAVASTGIWDPVEAIYSVSPYPAVGVILLAFIVVAQVTTNLTMNILPAVMTLIEITKISWEKAVLIVGILGVIVCPWALLTSENFFKFIAYYSAFLGPLIGILLTDFYLIRDQKYDIEELYSNDGPYTYSKGYNITSIIALVIGFIPAILFFKVSWMVGLPVSAISYYLLMKQRKASDKD